MAKSSSLTFTFNERQHPVAAVCPYCGEVMPPPGPGYEAPLQVIYWGTEEFLKHRSVEHPEFV